MTGHGDKLDTKREVAIAALLSAPSLGAAAAAAGISESTLSRWLRDTAFSDAFLSAKRDVLAQSTARLVAVSAQAIDCLTAVLVDSSAPASARISAAKAVLDYGYRGCEVDDLAARISAVEELVAEKAG